MAKKARKNRRRRDKDSMTLYGPNPRRVFDEYKGARARLIYACNVLFAGDQHEFAAAAGLCYRHLYCIMLGRFRLTTEIAAQIVSRTGIRAEWLLCGVGSIIATPENVPDSLVLPLQLSSRFPLFDTATENAGVDFLPAEKFLVHETPVVDLAPYEAAAGAMFAAHANSKSVGVFLGSAAFAVPAAQLVLPFFTARYADFLVLTLAAAAHDVQAAHDKTPIDINSVARFAAQRGIGYGEALSLVGFSQDVIPQKSLVASLRDADQPVIISTEIGEIGRHSGPNIRGAEIGAAIGAAAYVDLMIYTEQLRKFFGDPGGVMVIAGDCRRGVHMFFERLETLKLAVPVQTGFTFVLFSQPDAALEAEITMHGGHVIFLNPPTITTLSQLFQTCNDVYAGKINHERRKSSDRTV